MIDHHRRMLAYDDWANRETIGSLRACGAPPPRAILIMAHVVGAERLWLARLTGARSPLAVWPEMALAQCEAETAALGSAWTAYLDARSPASLSTRIEYTNSKGEPWGSRVGDILTHVVAHSAYHRGQVASEIRAAGYAPAATDFIHAVRTGRVE